MSFFTGILKKMQERVGYIHKVLNAFFKTQKQETLQPGLSKMKFDKPGHSQGVLRLEKIGPDRAKFNGRPTFQPL